jgi:uncharacterized membrane protein YeaQ/YmgE (transglycosylase-associated protein family)
VDVIGVIVAGIIIGLLGKFVAPGNRDNIPLWLTVLCGIGGVLIGYYIAAALGDGQTARQGDLKRPAIARTTGAAVGRGRAVTSGPPRRQRSPTTPARKRYRR